MILSEAAWRAAPELLAGFLFAALITLLATPLVRRYARRLEIVDRPEARRVNTRPVARGGGFAIAVGFLPVSLALLWLNAAGSNFVEQPHEIEEPQLVALLAGGLLAVLIGALDDMFQLRARWQFLGQLVLAGFAIALGILITTLNNPFGDGFHPVGIAAVALTTFWIVGMVNSINVIDGLDGLSSGIALIASLTLGGISLTKDFNQPFVALFCFVLAGALLGFLRWNFHPASIFAGTSGTMLVGYTLAVLSILGTAKIAVALLVLGVPILDTFWIIVRRIAAGRPPFAPDRGHIHHRLLDLGLSHRNTVLFIYAICTLLAVLSFALSGKGAVYAFLGLVLLSGLGLYAITRIGGRPEVDLDLDASSYEGDAAPGNHGPELPGSPPPRNGSPVEAPPEPRPAPSKTR